MAAVTSAVVTTAVAVKSSRDQKKAQEKAAEEQEEAQIQSAQVLGEASAQAQEDILRAQERAAGVSRIGAREAEERLTPFADIGGRAFTTAQNQILRGSELGGPLAESIRRASLEAVQRPSFDLSGPVGPETLRQAGLAASAATPAFRQSLLTTGQQGLAAIGDIAGIRQRGTERLADLAQATGAGRASVLVGQTPQLAQLSSGAQQARLLGDVAGQQFQSRAGESLAQLAGRIF